MAHYEAVYQGTSPVRIPCLGRTFEPIDWEGVEPTPLKPEEAERAIALRVPLTITCDGRQVWPVLPEGERGAVFLKPGERVPPPGGQYMPVDEDGNVQQDREAGLNAGDPAPPLTKGLRWMLVDATRWAESE
ncbi:MAG: hypothetical protein U9R79_06190 [Armatimonadota bacterium]|nr:hypothetical protein [Armatimonadota bacterium]